ncbi:histidine ABC transporter permease HisQ [Acidisoma cellulosilytica]|uniref:Histidine ABC transporter permease HisQ n=1 Tax=Acidisoma cellulosilyticum TaxID=2802395 RepID=A0A963Z3X8_9PROT|nr:histidine ABC transporter permease HisQ [Acidisoma cellulosilyticum]MCB8882364.1 histidine ABC transporter permease HisQ [Acidisoma cellulosilyticum]
MFNLGGYGPIILSGTLTTIELSILSLIVSFLIGLLGASAKLSRSRIAVGIATVYTTIIRAVPDLVLMLLLFYSLQIWLNDLTDALGLDQFNLDPFTSGVITLGFIYGAYFTETFRGAFMSVPRGQMEAARSFGMRRFYAFRRILFPQMMRYALPGLANNWQVILKATALVSIIGLSDIIKATQDAGKATFNTFFFSVLAAVVYLVLTTASNGVLMLLQKRYSVGVRRAAS